MAQQFDHYCHNCGGRGDSRNPRCEACGAVRALNKVGLIAKTAFVLNELRAWPLADILTTQQRARAETYYEDQLSTLTRPAVTAAVPVAPSPAFAPSRPVARRVSAIPQPAPAPRKEMDWSWLTEQQANLFLFAGAFLTVIAALIYVGYSGQAVSGALKMTLLAVYTAAFLAGGAICLRIPRVETAGRVFFAIGSVLLPINFVAARTLAEDSDLSRETLWLTGSFATAAFWTAVAYAGLGRAYAIGGGFALMSAVLAFVVRVDMDPAWIPLTFLVLATGMSLTSITGHPIVRSRIGEIWTLQAHAVALSSVIAALAFATFAVDGLDDDYSVATRWFLPISMAAFTGYALLQMASTREQAAALAAVVGFAATVLSTGFSIDAPTEGYVLLAAGLAVAFGGLMLAAAAAPAKAPLARESDNILRWAAYLSTGLALTIALFVLQLASDRDIPAYTVHNRWFLPATFALLAVFYGIDAFARRQRIGTIALLASVVGTAASMVYAFDLSPEYYAFGFVLPPVAIAALARWAKHPLLDRLDPIWREDSFVFGYAAVVVGVTTAVLAAFAGADQDTTFEPQFRLYLALAMMAGTIFAAIDASRKNRAGAVALAGGFVGIGCGIVYAIDPSAEFYAFGPLVTAIVVAVAARFAPERISSWLPDTWRADALAVGRVAVAGGVAVALGALAVSEDRTPNTYEPATRWFLPLAFVASAAFFTLDASRGKRPEFTAALLISISACIVSLPYALELQAEYYGVALLSTGLMFAVGGRAWSPEWIDELVRDVLAAVAVTASWLLFEGAYADVPRIGAAVHFAAAAFYFGAAVTDQSTLTLGTVVDMPNTARVRVASGWLYAAGLTAVLGYIFTLQSLPASDEAGSGTMAVSLMFASTAFAAAGAVSKLWRPEFRMHFYVMALAVTLVSLASGGTVGSLTLVLCVYIAMFAAIALYENEPLLGAPAVLFGFAAVATWREYSDADWALLPTVYCVIGVIAGAIAVLLANNRRWASSIGAAAALFLGAAPVIGIGLLISQTEASRIEGTLFYETALYQATVIATAVLGVASLAAAVALTRRWIIVPATTVLTIALLLQIGRFNPENAQAYTIVIGAYLVLLGTFGLSRFRLIPELEDLAPYVEGLGAAIFMFPSFVQSLEAGWRYQWILLLEGSLFFAAGVTLRRRGLLAVALLALVAVAGRALFDAVNALPNWVVVMVAGVSLLGIGMGILLGRDRWTHWQETLVHWWEQTDNGHAVP